MLGYFGDIFDLKIGNNSSKNLNQNTNENLK